MLLTWMWYKKGPPNTMLVAIAVSLTAEIFTFGRKAREADLKEGTFTTWITLSYQRTAHIGGVRIRKSSLVFDTCWVVGDDSCVLSDSDAAEQCKQCCTDRGAHDVDLVCRN